MSKYETYIIRGAYPHIMIGGKQGGSKKVTESSLFDVVENLGYLPEKEEMESLEKDMEEYGECTIGDYVIFKIEEAE